MTEDVKQQILDALSAEYDIPKDYERSVKRESLVYNFSFFPGADGAICATRSSIFEGSVPMPFMAKFHWKNTFDIDQNLPLLVEYLHSYTLLQSAYTETERTKIHTRVKELTDKLLDGFQLQGLTISYYPEKANTQPVAKNHHYYLFIKLLMNELETTTGYLFIMLLSGIEDIIKKRYYDDFLHKYDSIESMPVFEQPRMLTEPMPQKTGDLYFGIDANDLDFAQTNHKHVYTSLTNQMPTPSSSPSDHADAPLEDVLEYIQVRYAQKYTHNF